VTNDDKPANGSEDEVGELTHAEREALAEIEGVLADPAAWAEPPAGLQEQIVAAIAGAKAPQRRSRARLYAVLGTAAAVVLAAGVVIGVNVGSSSDKSPVEFSASLVGSALEPGASGGVTLTKTTSGWKIHLHAKGLPRRADGSYYEAWLKSPDGLLVPVGTFNSFEDVTLWSGVPPTTHPTFTVTRQLANGNPASTGQVVLSGATSLDD
jgi:hypothetical protein